MATYTETISDNVGLLSNLGYALGLLLTNNVGFTNSVPVIQYQAGALAVGNLGLKDAPAPKMTYSMTITEVLGLVDRLNRQLPVAIVETLGFTGVLHVARAVIVMEKLGLLDVLTDGSVSQLKMIETLAFDDAILSFFGLGGSDAFGISGTFTAEFQFNKTVSDTVGFTAEMVGTSLFMRIVTDTLGLEDIDIPAMIYNQVLIDCIDFSIGFIDPGTNEFTAWAINTRTNAVTEYQNWGNFDSFCQIGVDYYGANSTGLWKLNAQTDNGADIVADIKGAMLSLGGSRFTQLDGVYLGMRVSDNARDFILKLIVPNGGAGGVDAVYLYKFTPKNMRTTKVNIGKGLRARYIQWELITPGPDFDLDSIEFVPVMSKRRV